MLWTASVINGYAVAASDGQIGTVSDFLFDDTNWLVRWLVVDTGNWLSGRKVLLPPSVLGHLDPKEKTCSVKLTMQQVKDSPEIDTDLPVSRQMETSVYGYYGWSPYWGAGATGGYAFMPGGISIIGGTTMAAARPLGSRLREEAIAEAELSHDDPHLRSIEAVNGYHIHASDGEIGHVDDFLIGDADWSIRYLVVDTKNWWAGKKVLISPRSVAEIDWVDRLVNIDVDRQRIKDSPAYDAATTIDQAYDERFLTYYGIRLAAA